MKIGYSRNAWSELETGQVKHMTHQQNRQTSKSIRYTIRLAQQGSSMGRAFGWLTSQRPAMVEILKEIERSSNYTGSESNRGDLTLLLAHLSHVAAGTGGRPRSIQAMRQAWWRWTSDGATPPLRDLALIVRHAKNRGWLKRLKPDCVPLVERLANELEEVRASQRRVLEVAWGPAARVAVEKLFDHLESRIARRANDEGDETWDFEMPAALVVQEEVRTMLREVVERVVVSLDTPREMTETEEGEPLLHPFDGWPDFFRSLGKMTAEILNDVAGGYEEFEASLIPEPPEGGPRRVNMFKRDANEPNQD